MSFKLKGNFHARLRLEWLMGIVKAARLKCSSYFREIKNKIPTISQNPTNLYSFSLFTNFLCPYSQSYP